MTQAHPDGVRLQKVLAQAGVASRRAAEELIAAGRVTVDGEVVREMGRRVHPESAVVHVDGLRIVLDDALTYLALNKPRGVLSTMHDDQGRRCPIAGATADVYEFHAGHDRWAVKCFTRTPCGLGPRYALLFADLLERQSPWLVGFHYLDQGVFIRGRFTVSASVLTTTPTTTAIGGAGGAGGGAPGGGVVIVIPGVGAVNGSTAANITVRP